VTDLFKSKSTLDRTIETLLGREIQKLNIHLPKQRRTLGDLLSSTDTTIQAMEGPPILLKPSELADLAKIVPAEYHSTLKLPFVVLRRMELGKSVYSVAGEKLEEFTVKKILGLTQTDYHQMYFDQQPTLLYRPQVSELIGRFHSLVVIGFGVPRELVNQSPRRD
jgi:uncharacterized protein (UPF0216 family)